MNISKFGSFACFMQNPLVLLLDFQIKNIPTYLLLDNLFLGVSSVSFANTLRFLPNSDCNNPESHQNFIINQINFIKLLYL
jgi:hypothetical protein